MHYMLIVGCAIVFACGCDDDKRDDDKRDDDKRDDDKQETTAHIDTVIERDTIFVTKSDTIYITKVDTIHVDNVRRVSGSDGASADTSNGTKLSIPELFKVAQPAVGTVHVSAYGRGIRESHQGSGFFVAADGRFATSSHVIPSNIFVAKVRLANGTEYPIERVLVRDDEKDLMLVSVDIPTDSLSYLSVSSTLPKIGADILVIGSPKGLAHTATRGIVSAVRRDDDYGTVIQIDAPISPGSSGSPVLTMDGVVIGVATYKEEGENLNFAVPGDNLLELVEASDSSGELAEVDAVDDLRILREGVQELVTFDLESLDSIQVAMISQVFAIPRQSISKFRWGTSLAPSSHRLAGSVWYTIWYEKDGTQLSSTVRMDSTGNHID